MKKTNDFHFKTFSVIQQKSAMKVNTDSVILGASAKHKAPKKALDIGTGTGLLALIMAHKYPQVLIDAIDIEKNSIEEAHLNFKNTKWSNRIKAKQISLQNFTPTEKYDIIITNPPYFINSSKNKTVSKTNARHTNTLSYTEIIEFTNKHLSEEGSLYLILPKTEADIFIKKSLNYNIFLSSKLNIKPLPNKDTNRIILHFKTKQNKLTNSNTLVIYKKHREYSNEYIELTKDFYLNF